MKARKRIDRASDMMGDMMKVDEAVEAELPPACEVTAVTLHGVHTRITVQLHEGRTADFFLKIAYGPLGAAMMKGSFEADSAIHKFLPSQVPMPVAWGTTSEDSHVHFYLCEFEEMSDDLPKASEFAATVAVLHRSSKGKSPTGMFGFHVPTHLANVPLDNTWNQSWQAFWTQQMQGLFDHEEQTMGPDPELTTLKTAFLERTIPRYLGPLESEGRTVEPCLIHSDLWPGNIKPRTATGELCIFDACAYWGHNEADLAICRNPRYRLGRPCIDEYTKLMPVSEPVEDFDGRNAVYAMKFHVLLSIMHGTRDPSYREILKTELQALTK